MKHELSKERLEEIAADGFVAHGEIKAMARALLAAHEQEPVADVVAWSHPTEERTCDVRLRRFDVAPGPLYTHPAPSIPAAVPEDVLSRLEHEANHVTEWHHMDEHSCKVNRRDLLTLVSACRAAMLQSEPDGWIPVSERLPEEGGRYWCYVEEQNSLGKSHYQWSCSWNGSEWSDAALTGRVTHWQPLPAAPKV